MAGDKNCVAQGVNSTNHNSYNGVFSKTLSSPFHKRMIMPWWEWLKIIIMSFTIAPIRLLMVTIFLLMTWFLSFVAVSTSDKQKPLSGWRLWIKSLYCITARAVFFAGGFHWITTRGQRSSVEEAPILVLAPHSSYLDSIIIVYLGLCSVVGKEETAKITMVGKLLLTTEPILVSREERHSRRKTVCEIQRRTQNTKMGWPQIAIFPEGTCTNRTCLIKYKMGAFIPGVPVQPVLIRWNNRVDTTVWTWDGPNTWTLLWLSLCQFHNYVSVEFLPVYQPSAEEASDPSSYARNVQLYMSDRLGVPISDYSYEDSRMLDLAIRKKLPCASIILELVRLQNFFDINELTDVSIERLPTNPSYFEFSKFLSVPESPLLERIYHHYKHTKESPMDFRRFCFDIVLLSHASDQPETLEWIFKIFANDSSDTLSSRQAEELITIMFPSVADNSDRIFPEASVARDDTVSLNTFLDTCQALMRQNVINVYFDFIGQVTRLKQSYDR